MAAGSVTRPHTHSRRHRLVCLHAAAITARFRGSQCLHAASRRRSPSSHASSRTQIATPSPPTANRAAFPRDAASHRYPRGLPSPRRLSSPSPSPATSLRLRLARRPRRADALHAAVAHEARSSPCAADSSVPSSAAGAPLLSSRLLPPSTLAERKAVPLASPSPYPTRARRASLPHLKLGPLAPPVRHSTPPPARDPTARRFRDRGASKLLHRTTCLGGFQIGIKPSRTSTTASASMQIKMLQCKGVNGCGRKGGWQIIQSYR
ncbi:serine/arginine repetitive matrix protein 1-like isoform X3 [Panicum virgatum]|uniref:serine/arginine repetitive matrix protein 1-like isoform X3 n=1 Tax=Panicum virgatum TaxID=38727 RepID=UPI0019D5CBC4|nr:serine/arginine repetitive matrix protein 1-like isoform X3 [Panicum virgatum]